VVSSRIVSLRTVARKAVVSKAVTAKTVTGRTVAAKRPVGKRPPTKIATYRTTGRRANQHVTVGAQFAAWVAEHYTVVYNDGHDALYDLNRSLRKVPSSLP
jgi:hypothetical protein